MKNKIRMGLIVVIGILLLTGLASSQTASDLPIGVEKVEDCKLEYDYQKMVDTISCEKEKVVCSDEPTNSSCETVTYQDECLGEPYYEAKARQVCETQAFIINDEVKVDAKEYECSVNKDNSEYVVLCDSKTDGNGDGICTPGETCQKFTIDGKNIQRLEKNSRVDFVTSDESFVFTKTQAEVLK